MNAEALAGEERERHEAAVASPVAVLQIGEGNFLRGFFDWMIHVCRRKGLFAGGVAVTQPRPAGRPNLEKLAAQDGLYTLVIRGLESGVRVERKETISVFSAIIDPYREWGRFLELAEGPELRFVVSNTTEAGLVYRGEPLPEKEAVASFPGKMTLLLYRRYQAFGGDPDKGLLFLPCELLERNGDRLRECVLRHAADWGLPKPFADWVRTHNRFLNTLVDRIVTGYPDDGQAEKWFGEWGYRDELLAACEPYHLWAIEAEPGLEQELPLRAAGLNVVWTADLTPFQQRKVRILNGAHTLMAPLGLLHGVEQVRELMEHPALGAFVTGVVEDEIIPSLPYPAPDMRAYAATVFERYRNPFIRHRLADIAMNGISKSRARLLPTMAYYAERGRPVPGGLCRGMAGLLRYYRVERSGDGFRGRTLSGVPYEVRDEAGLLGAIADTWAAGRSLEATVRALLAESVLWGRDLTEWQGFAEAVAGHMTELERIVP